MTLEEAVNQAVFDDLPVSISFVSREQMSSMNVRSRLLPDGLEGPFRLVGIEGIDLNTCGGTHVQSTGQIQVVKILGTEKLARGVRVFYAAGSRARRIFEQTIERESAIGAALTTGPSDFIASIEALKKSGRDLDTSLRQLSARLAGLVVERMLEDAGSGQVAVYHQDEADGDFLRQVAERFHERVRRRLLCLPAARAKGCSWLSVPMKPFAASAGRCGSSGRRRQGAIFQGRARAFAPSGGRDHCLGICSEYIRQSSTALINSEFLNGFARNDLVPARMNSSRLWSNEKPEATMNGIVGLISRIAFNAVIPSISGMMTSMITSRSRSRFSRNFWTRSAVFGSHDLSPPQAAWFRPLN